MKDGCDVDVFDLVVVLIRTGPDFNSSDEDVFKFSFVVFGLDGINESSKVGVVLDVKSCIPLAVFVCKGYLFERCAEHGKNQNES